MRKLFMVFLTRALVAYCAITTPAGAEDAELKQLATLSSMLDELRHGGFVIFLRHGVTEKSTVNGGAEDLANCEQQRNLSAKGRADAMQIGKAIKALGIPIGTVAASPYCRAKDTAQLAFGRYTEAAGLGFVIDTNADETRQRAATLRRMLGTQPEPGVNNVIISHSANLFEAATLFAKPEGVAYVFRPLADGSFEVVGRILPDDWGLAVSAGARLGSRVSHQGGMSR